MISVAEKLSWKVKVQVEKFEGKDIDEFRNRVGQTYADLAEAERDFYAKHQPDSVEHFDGNILLNAGIALMEDLLIGAGGTVFNNANSYLGVGDSATAEVATQTDLQASSNKLRKVMDATFPSRASQTVTWKSTFASSEANYVWNEWCIFNASTAGTALNRKVQSMGTKASGSSWALTVTVAIS